MTDTMKFRTNLRLGALSSNHSKTQIRDTAPTTWLRSKTRVKASALSMVVLVTITCALQTAAQAARFTTPRPSTAEDVSAQLIENTGSAFGNPADGRDVVRERPIEDFIEAQGTTAEFYQGPYAPGLPDYAVGFTTADCPGEYCQYPTSRIAVADYAGGANKYLVKHGYGSLGTKTYGSITERSLSDGRAEVTVVLYTSNALTFASTFDYSLPSPPQSAETNTRLFGSSVQDLFRDPRRRPALGNSNLILIFKNTKPGAPMPDLVQLFAFGVQPKNFELLSVYFKVNAGGSLPDGKKGLCTVLEHYVNPPPLLIDGVLTTPSLLDGNWISEFVDIK